MTWRQIRCPFCSRRALDIEVTGSGNMPYRVRSKCRWCHVEFEAAPGSQSEMQETGHVPKSSDRPRP